MSPLIDLEDQFMNKEYDSNFLEFFSELLVIAWLDIQGIGKW